jgi:hypothetical protein
MLKAKLLGATAAAEVLAIEDVFSTYLYTGNGSTQTITNGIDLAGEGGLVWIKSRSAATDNFLFDTTRGATKEINSNGSAAEATLANSLTAFNANGFSIGSATGIGVNADTYASWTFRQAPRFFDVVTYTGTGANRTIAHDLGVVPGCIIVKRTDTTGDWQVYHRSIANTEYLVLNSTAAKVTGATRWNSTTPTSTVFSLGTDATVNASGGTYVAYLYAHDPLGPSGDGSDGLIACGSYTGNGSATGPTVSLGWEPQWLLVKRSDSTGDWNLIDNMRGLVVGGTDAELNPNLSNAESTGTFVSLTATGFQLNTTDAGYNASGGTYTYIAIRRGPMREPTVGTQVFAVANGTTPVPTWKSGFPVDLGIYKATGGNDSSFVTRLLGKKWLAANSTAAEAAQTNAAFDYQNGHFSYYDASLASWYSWMFRRAPGFFDVVAYTGDGASNRQINHNLAAPPELTIIKVRDQPSRQWIVRCSYLPNPNDEYFFLSLSNGLSSLSGIWLTPTDTTFGLGIPFAEGNNSGWNYISYLFASLPGISKVGSYTGNGSSQTINCAFTTGARFILIKRTNSTGDWYVWDTARGIVSGNDPHLSLNTTAAEVTSDDTIDPDNSGFIVNQVAATNVNVNAATYIFYAVS